MKGRAFAAVVLSALLLLSGLGFGGWWLLWQRGPLQLARQPLTMPRAARFVPASASFSLYLFSDGQRPVDYARAVAPARQRRPAGEAIARLRDGAFAAAGLDYQDELAGWLGGELAMALFEDPLAAASGAKDPSASGWLLALASRDDDGARRFLQRFWQTRSLAGTDLQVSRYRGMGLISGRGALLGSQPEPLATALVDDDLVLIASGRNLLERALDVSQIPELNQAGQPTLRQGIAAFSTGAALAVASPQALQSWLGLPSLETGSVPPSAAPAASGAADSAEDAPPASLNSQDLPTGGGSLDPVDIGGRAPAGRQADGGSRAASPAPRPSADRSDRKAAAPPASASADTRPPTSAAALPASEASEPPVASAAASGSAGSGTAAQAPATPPLPLTPSTPSDAAEQPELGASAGTASAPSSAPGQSASGSPPEAAPPEADATGSPDSREAPSAQPAAPGPEAAPPPEATPLTGDLPAPAARQRRAPWAVQPAIALLPAAAPLPGPAAPTLLAVLQPQGRQLELRARLLLPQAPQLEAAQPELDGPLLAALRGSPSSLALIQDPASLIQLPLLRPLLERSLGLRPQSAAERQGPLPALLLRSIHGPLLASRSSEGWQLASRAGDPAAEDLEPLLRQAGLLEAPLDLDGHSLKVWTRLSLPARGGRRDRSAGDALVAPLAGWREQRQELAWWGQTLAALEAPAESRALATLRHGLRDLNRPLAPVQLSLDADAAGGLLRSWQPWRLLSALAGGGLDKPVRGLALAVESPQQISALELRARLNLGG